VCEKKEPCDWKYTCLLQQRLTCTWNSYNSLEKYLSCLWTWNYYAQSHGFSANSAHSRLFTVKKFHTIWYQGICYSRDDICLQVFENAHEQNLILMPFWKKCGTTWSVIWIALKKTHKFKVYWYHNWQDGKSASSFCLLRFTKTKIYVLLALKETRITSTLWKFWAL